MKRTTLLLYALLSSTLFYGQDKVFEYAREGNTNAIETLYKANSKIIDTINHKGFGLLMLTVYNNHEKTTLFLLKHNVNVDMQDRSGNTALMGACFKGDLDMVKLLIAHEANVNIKNYNDATALTFAATFGHTSIVKELIENKADANIKDNRGNTAFDHAKIQGNEEILKVLKQQM